MTALALSTCVLILFTLVGPPPRATLEQELERRGVRLETKMLLAALSHEIPRVRQLAALKLSQDQVKEAVPHLSAAMGSEKDSTTKLTLAAALASLGSEQGVAVLKVTCVDPHEDADRRIKSATMLLLASNNESCFDAVLEVILSKSKAPRDAAAQLILGFKDNLKDPEQKGRATLAISTLLGDSDPYIRVVGSTTLRQLGDPSGIPYLAEAVAAERSPDIRNRFAEDLAKLEQKAGKE